MTGACQAHASPIDPLKVAQEVIALWLREHPGRGFNSWAIAAGTGLDGDLVREAIGYLIDARRVVAREQLYWAASP